MSIGTKLLLIDDDRNILITLQMRLEALGHRVLIAENGEKGLILCESEMPDLVLLDLKLPDMDGLEVLKKIRTINPWIEVIMLTAVGSIESAVKAIKLGAYDYLSKPIDSKQLKSLVEKALKKGEVSREIRQLRNQYKTLGAFGSIIGMAPRMQEIYRLIEQVSQTDATILITGESGTGKELVAQTIHILSPRQAYPFIPVNCAAIPTNLWESEILGHEKGSFTGADAKKIGFFEMANHGTLFLDEISEIPVENQAKFLRVLENHRVRRVGGDEEIQVNVRVIAATNWNLLKAIELNRFRQDLYYRLNHINIDLPPLRDRKEDIPALAQAFLADAAERYNKPFRSLSREAMALLLDYSWPGNIRELKNVIERAVVFCEHKEIEPDYIKESLKEKPTDPGMFSLAVGTSLEEAERVLILKTLRSTGGNKSKAAKLLGISLKTFYNKLNKYEQIKEHGTIL
jgi:DNA-binding NtrC family response regulator